MAMQGRILTRDRDQRPDVLEVLQDPYIRKMAALGRFWSLLLQLSAQLTAPILLHLEVESVREREKRVNGSPPHQREQSGTTKTWIRLKLRKAGQT